MKYTFPWKTLPEWDGTCREFVLTRSDGVQHRAYFLFSKARSFPVSGHVRHANGTPAAGATVTLKGTQSPLTATTDASGFYEFESILAGVYAATASTSGCEVQAKQVEVKRKTNPRLHARSVLGRVRLRLLGPAGRVPGGGDGADADRRRRVGDGGAAVHVQVLRHGVHHGVRVHQRRPELPGRELGRGQRGHPRDGETRTLRSTRSGTT